MSNFQIHELSTGALDRDSNIVHDTEVSTDVWNTRKATAGAVADLALEVVASVYDDTASYSIGSYCIYSGVLYRCTTATTGAFDVSDWTAVLITGEYKRVRVMHKADFDLLTPEEQADGMIFVDDVDITADDISYSAGVSVADMFTTSSVSFTPNATGISTNLTKIVQIGKLLIISVDVAFSSDYIDQWKDVLTISNKTLAVENAYFGCVSGDNGTSTYAQIYQSGSDLVLRARNVKTATNNYRGIMIVPIV